MDAQQGSPPGPQVTMKIVRDAKGRVLAGFEVAAQDGVRIEPELEEGQTFEEVTVPREALSDLDAFFKSCRK